MKKSVILMAVLGVIAFFSCEAKKSDENNRNENMSDSVDNKSDSVGITHENTPPGTETDTFGTNPEK